jgi:hypothetical protein
MHIPTMESELASLERLVRHAASKLENRDVDTASMALESAIDVIRRIKGVQ